VPRIEAAARAAIVDALPHVAIILRAGVQHVLLSLGDLGCALCSLCGRTDAAVALGICSTARTPQALGSETGSAGGSPGSDRSRWSLRVLHMTAPRARVVNVNGAGDCLVAGTVMGLQRGLALDEAVACGAAAARRACESAANVPDLCGIAVLRESRAVLESACREVFRL